MTEAKIDPQKLFIFGRSFLLLFNRSTMYEANHPYCTQAIDELLPTIQTILKTHSPLVFIMNQEQLFVDEEPVDQRINTSKMVAHFKKTEIQSISFYEGIDRKELATFVEIFTGLKKYPNAGAMKKELETKGISHIRLNHVFFKKVSSDEEVISREAFKKMSIEASDGGPSQTKKLFMDSILESVLAEEFEKTITVKNVMENPADVSNQMIEADLKGYTQNDAPDRSHGPVLAHQLNILEEEVEKNLSSQGSAELSALAGAVFDMKRQLIKGIEIQKSLGIDYSNEEEILDKANEIADKVILQLVKDEYKSGKISTARLAQILKRLVPEPNELKRLLPKIKDALLEEGMPLSDYLNLVQELSNELQSEELSKVLQQSAETVGLDGQDLIQEVKNNPVQAAELIFLAAEIRKGAGDESVLTDLLVDYVEKIGSKLTLDKAKEDNVEGEEHLQQVMNRVESQILGRLKKMDIKDDVIMRLEEKLNSRMDDLFETIKEKWSHAPTTQPEKKEAESEQSVLQILEHSVSDNEELTNILRMVRYEVQSKGLDENDFKNILEEITEQKENRQKRKAKKWSMSESLDADGLMFFLDKEISRSLRYDLPFATLSFSIVSAKPKSKPPEGDITHEVILAAVLQRFTSELRSADMAALPGKNKLVAVLPMTTPDEAKLALRRHLRLINKEPFDINGILVTVQVAGVVTNFDTKRTPNTDAFLTSLSNELSEMVNRIKNIHGLT
jgi:GGDEF domain-containing protein